MPQYSLLGLTPSNTTRKAKRPRPISKRAFFFCLGTSFYAIAGLMDLVAYWSNVNDEEDDEFNDPITENATPMAALAAFCYIIMSTLAISATTSTLSHGSLALTPRHLRPYHHRTPWWQLLLEEQLQVRAEYTLQLWFLLGSILLFAAEELKTHKIMRSLRKQQRTSQWCYVISLHLFWLSAFGLHTIIPMDKSKGHDDEPPEDSSNTIQNSNDPPLPQDVGTTEGSLEKCGRIFMILGTTIDLSIIYIDYFSRAKISTGSILMGTFVSALFWWTNALLVGMTERYYYPDHLDHLVSDNDSDNNKIVDFSFEDAMNLPDRLRQRMAASSRRTTMAPIRVV